MAFKIAGRLAIRSEAMAKADPVLLEPVSLLEVTVPIEYQGDVMGDSFPYPRAKCKAAARPAQVRAKPDAASALVPTSEIMRYAIDLRSLTGGRGRFTATHDHYDVLPSHLVDKVKRETKEQD